ncbi:MAG: cytochrome c3 family protein [Paracoccaceae bacterium]
MTGFIRMVCAIAATLLWSGLAQAQGFVGSDTCADCHTEAAEAWAGSHHALAWTAPSDATVIGDFDDASYEGEGMTVRFARNDDGFTIDVTEADGTTRKYPVHSVIGIAPLQQYALETEPGRLQSFDVVWDVEGEEWVHLYPGDAIAPDDGLHWTGPYKTWNARCAECHATDYRRAYSPQQRRYNSRSAELGVGCEACHGPGQTHVDWAADPSQPMPEAGGFSMDYVTGSTEAAIQQCAGCHARRENLTDGNPVPGTPFHDAYRLALLRPGLYHADGQILDEVYVYGSFLQSKMYAQGVSCMNCHEAHSATLVAEGNTVCTQCHSPAGNPDFPTLALQDYDTPEHHFHSEGSDRAQCKSCHMAERTYMQVDGRRDHSFRVPRPDLGAAMGSPDTCTDCHVDQTQGWAAEEIAKRFPDSRRRGRHFGQVLAQGRADPIGAAAALSGLASDTTQPGIARATALYLMQGSGQPMAVEALRPLMADPDPIIRGEAAALVAEAERATLLTPLLADPVRSVRIAAARQMLSVDPNGLSRSQIALLREAMADWRRSISNKLDFPETHLVMGGMALTTRNYPAAEAAFRETVRLDPQRAEAWSILVRMVHATRGLDAARAVLREALDKVPDDPALVRLRGKMGGE